VAGDLLGSQLVEEVVRPGVAGAATLCMQRPLMQYGMHANA
jgi:hypothetical protein